MDYSRIVLGPEFDEVPDDVVVPSGSLHHTDTVIEAYSVLQGYRRRRDLPWLVGWRMSVLFPPEVGRDEMAVADIFVHATLGWHDHPALSIAEDGPAALIIEVANVALPPEHDPRVGIPGGKAEAYAASGVAEYLVFDPTGDCGPAPLAAWRLGPSSQYRAWAPGKDGRWASSLGIAFAPEGTTLRVYDDAGVPLPTYRELADMLDERELAVRRRSVELERENAALREEIRRLRGEG